jgi:YhcH/YjgK/YiaL family protein
MIADTLSNAAKYYGMCGLLQKGLEWLAQTDLAALEAGRHEIDGDKLFVLIQEYDTKPIADCKWESHKLYADIQYIISGTELMGYAPVGGLTDPADHTPAKDVINYTDNNKTGVYFTANHGDFFVFLPHDGHQPNIINQTSVRNKKAVVKILM